MHSQDWYSDTYLVLIRTGFRKTILTLYTYLLNLSVIAAVPMNLAHIRLFKPNEEFPLLIDHSRTSGYTLEACSDIYKDGGMLIPQKIKKGVFRRFHLSVKTFSVRFVAVVSDV